MAKIFKLVLPNEKGIFVIPAEYSGCKFIIRDHRCFVILEEGKQEILENVQELA